MTHVWRLVAESRAKTAFDGEGSFLYGNRWNLPGTRVVYMAETTSLAALEVLVQAGSPDHLVGFAAIPVSIPPELIVDLGELPSDWNESPAPPGTQRAGSEWEASRVSAVLRVPSVVVPWESNFVAAVNHPDFSALRVGESRPFRFDRRFA